MKGKKRAATDSAMKKTRWSSLAQYTKRSCSLTSCQQNNRVIWDWVLILSLPLMAQHTDNCVKNYVKRKKGSEKKAKKKNIERTHDDVDSSFSCCTLCTIQYMRWMKMYARAYDCAVISKLSHVVSAHISVRCLVSVRLSSAIHWNNIFTRFNADRA